MSNKTVYCIIFCVRLLVSVVTMTVSLIVNAKCECDEKIHHESWQRQEKMLKYPYIHQKWCFHNIKWKLLCAQKSQTQHFTSLLFISFHSWHETRNNSEKTYGSTAEKPFPNNLNAFMCKFSFHNKAKEVSNAKSDEAVDERRNKLVF